MVSMEYDIVVDDEEYITCTSYVKRQCELANDLLDKYCRCMDIIVENTVTAGKTHDAMVCFLKYVKGLRGLNTTIYEKFSDNVNKFLKKIDEEDDVLYEGDFAQVRIFNESELKKLKKIFRQSPYDRFEKWIEYIVAVKSVSILSKNILGNLILTKCQGIFDSITEYEREVSIYNTLKEKRINEIFDNVVMIDKEYSSKFEQYIAGEKVNPAIDLIESTIKAEIAVIRAMTELLSKGTDNFTIDNISFDLTGSFNEITSMADKFSLLTDDVTIEEIQRFVEFDENISFYKNYQNILDDEYNEDDWSYSVLNDIYNGKDILIEFAKNAWHIPKYIKENKSKLYDYILIKKNICSFINDMLDSESPEQYLMMDELFKNYNENTAVEIYKIFTKGNAALYDDKTVVGNGCRIFVKYSKKLNELNEYYKDIIDGTKYAGKVEKIIAPLLFNYVKNIELLKSISANMPDDELTSIAINDLIDEYTNHFKTAGKKLIEETIDSLGDEGIDKFAESIFGSETFSAITITKECFNKITGYDTAFSSMIEFRALYQINDSLIDNYKNNFNIVKAAGSDVTEEQANNLYNSFKLLQKTYIKEFNDLENYYQTSDPVKRMYYNELAANLAHLSMSDKNPLNSSFISLDEFAA